jgi:hypothetical protein
LPDEGITVDQTGAAEALEGLLAAQEGGPPAPEPRDDIMPEPPAPAEQAPVEPVAPAAEPTPAPETAEEFVPRADLESLLEGVNDEAARQAVIDAYKSFNRDYTQKTQSLAAERRRLQGIDPDAAQQSIEFFEKLQSDREFALGVHRELSQALEAAGALQAPVPPEAPVAAPAPSNYEDYGIDPDNPLAKDLAELREWKAQEEQRRQTEAQEREYYEWQQNEIAKIETQALAIRKDNPQYDDEDMDAIYKIAASTGGDLNAARDYFESMQDRVVTNYIARKGKAPGGVTPAPGGGTSHSEAPQEFRNVKEAHKLASDWLKARMGQEG